MADADRESNLVQVDMSVRLPNLFAKETYQQALTEGVATYTLPSRLIAFQSTWLTTTSGGASRDTLMFAYSAFEYSALANKDTEGVPTMFYLNTVVPPQITFWPVPDSSSTYTFKAFVLRQFQDANLKSGYTLDVPYRALDAWVAKLSHRLARIYAPQRVMEMKMDADEAWSVFAKTDQEVVPLMFCPSLNGYFS